MTKVRTPCPWLPALAALGALAGCVPESSIEFDSSSVTYNRRLRHDHAALTEEQLRATDSPAGLDALGFGPYRTLPQLLVNPLRPSDAVADRLPQSDCWWLDPEGGQAMLANWEAILDLSSVEDARGRWVDPEDDRLEIGLCRFADPETRVPFQGVEGTSAIRDTDCGRLGGVGGVAVAAGPDFVGRCIGDAHTALTRLTAYAAPADTPAGNPYRLCLRPDEFAEVRTLVSRQPGLASGTDFFDGIGSGAAVNDCASGVNLKPPRATRYQVAPDGAPPTLGAGYAAWLDPVVMTAESGAKLQRALGPLPGGGLGWATPVRTQAGPGSAVRWEEGFSSALRVSRVRLLRLGPNGEHQDIASSGAGPAAGAPGLCIADPAEGAGCRWTCTSSGGRGAWSYDLTRDCRNRAGVSDFPAVTPTYAVGSANLGVLTQPLVWSLQPPYDQAARPAWIELGLISTGQGLALTAEPPVADLGGARVGEHRRGGFRVRNSGSHPALVTGLRLRPEGQPGDFSVLALEAPLVAPLPVELIPGDRVGTLRLTPDAESDQLGVLYRDKWHARLAQTRLAAFAHSGVPLRNDQGLLLRDRRDAKFVPWLSHPDATAPFGYPTWVQRRLPFELRPGETAEISVLGEPSALGHRQAGVEVSAVSTLSPALRASLVGTAAIWGLQGPTMHILPSQLGFPLAEGGGIEYERRVMIENVGDSTGSLGLPALAAPGGGRLPAGSPFALDLASAAAGPIASGESQLVAIRFRSDCTGRHGWVETLAELRWPTQDGALIVPLRASSGCP